MSSSMQGIEIYVTNIPHAIKEPHMKANLAKVLHNPPFRVQGEPPTNFKFSYGSKKDTRGRYGWLILPNERLGRLFLQCYRKGGVFMVANRATSIRFKPSTRQPPNQVITTLRTTPYADPADDIEREKQSQDLATQIGIVSIKFGVICRDTVFSAEYDTDTPDGSVSFNTIRRALIISTTHGKVRTLVVCRFPHIRRIWIDEDIRTPESLVELIYPPIFESYPTTLENPEEETIIRRRMSSYNKEHASMAAYCSRSILFTFGNVTDLRHFHAQVRKLTKDFPRPITTSLPMERRGLYSDQRIQQLSIWLETLPVKVGLQVELAVRNLLLDPTEILSLQSAINREVSKGREERVSIAMQLLNAQLADEGVSWGSHDEAVADLEKRFRAAFPVKQARRPEKAKASDPDYFQCYQVFVTPTTVELEGPYIDRSNRILRMYPDHHHHFLRVKFCDEDGSPLYFQRDIDFAGFVKERVGGILKRGIDIAGLHFDWLGYSSSALRDHQAWFVAPFRQRRTRVVNAARIRDEMGDFKKCIDQPAKYGARLSQAFTATNATIIIPQDQIQHNIDDLIAGPYCFTDGVGELSPELAQEIWEALQKTQKKKKAITPPTAFQGRFGGCKGVWMVNPELQSKGKIIRSRKSMVKFEAPNTRGFEVAATSHRPIKTYLNRPLVKLLEDLGVSVKDLLDLQEEAIDEIEAAGISYKNASSLFTTHGLGNSFSVPSLLFQMLQMLEIDFDFSSIQESDFIRSAVVLGIGQCLRDIKFRARIPVEGPTLIGVCDIYNILKEGEIYVKCTDKDGDQSALKGRYAITRSPILHPGDVQIVEAVGERPAGCPLRQLYNVVVFSSKGERPLPSYLSGGDLDGDIYNILTDSRLRPKRLYRPANYDAVTPKTLGRPSNIEDVADFFVDYVVNDQLGRINTLSMTIADFSQKGLADPKCLLLAQLGSHAVDFPKSGVPVDPRRFPRQPEGKPDFQSDYVHDGVLPEGVYRSSKALGQLFRAVPTEKFAKPPRETAHRVDASALSNALDALKKNYAHLPLPLSVPSSATLRQWDPVIEESCFQLRKIAYANTLSWRVNAHLTEEELFIGGIAKPGKFDRAQRENVSRVRAQTALIAQELRQEIKSLGSDEEESVDDDDNDEEPPERIACRIERAWTICHAAVRALKSADQPPYGIRIVGYFSLQLLLALVKAYEEVYYY